MSNIKKIRKAIENILDVMAIQEKDVNILVLKSLLNDYAEQSKILPLELSKEILNEFLYNKIEDSYSKKIQETEKEKVEEKYTIDNVFNFYFDNLLYGGSNETNKQFYYMIINTIWRPFMKAHRIQFAHKY